MKFQNPILNFERTDVRTEGRAQSNMSLQIFQSWGHNNHKRTQVDSFYQITVFNYDFKDNRKLKGESNTGSKWSEMQAL